MYPCLSLAAVNCLLTACLSGDLDLIKQLVETGSSLETLNLQGETIFHLCCSSRDCTLNIFEYLIYTSLAVRKSVSFSLLRNSNGSIPLHLVCAAGKKDFVDFLVPQYNSLNDFVLRPNSKGETPLYFASKNSNIEIVVTVCSSGHDICPDVIYQCIKVALNWPIMATLLKALLSKTF